MSFFSDLKVAGYPYDALVWGVVPPVLQPPGPLGHNMRDHLFLGGECQAILQGESTRNQAEVGYAAKLDQTPAAIQESQAHYDKNQPADPDDRTEGVGMARLARLENGTIVAEQRLPLEDLDRAHVIDRLTSAVLTWHAEVFGSPEPTDLATPRRGRHP